MCESGGGVGNYISPSAQFIGDIVLGSGNYFGDNCRVFGPITIGNDNHFAPGTIIGLVGQDDSLDKARHDQVTQGNSSLDAQLVIGDNNIFREYSTVHRGISGVTTVGSNIYLMTYANVSHDSNIQDNVKIASNVQMGGYTTVCRNAYIGMGALIHQFTVIGAYCMVGMGSVVTRDISTGSKAFGSPCREVGPNRIALERLGVTEFDWWDSRNFGQVDEIWGTNLQTEHADYLAATELRTKEKIEISKKRRQS
jgi:UDP-N-acetylglucosamine acyltransferase